MAMPLIILSLHHLRYRIKSYEEYENGFRRYSTLVPYRTGTGKMKKVESFAKILHVQCSRRHTLFFIYKTLVTIFKKKACTIVTYGTSTKRYK